MLDHDMKFANVQKGEGFGLFFDLRKLKLQQNNDICCGQPDQGCSCCIVYIEQIHWPENASAQNSNYMVTIHIVPNLLKTPKQMLRFSTCAF